MRGGYFGECGEPLCRRCAIDNNTLVWQFHWPLTLPLHQRESRPVDLLSRSVSRHQERKERLVFLMKC
ncbi:hypothetical protein TSUD_290940 [Trifolium subterraneum]|uniref:Uncharacterized protein n=1 Tax=Trifolium subterraneum TaxID=3900 RepID=A0A2Z6PT59_TRISU|nr:hypothetical protein TSUD_290940 [Trifolium subterraneum]